MFNSYKFYYIFVPVTKLLNESIKTYIPSSSVNTYGTLFSRLVCFLHDG